MLCGKRLPDSFWAETVLTAVILKKRSLPIGVKDKTSYESFLGKTPNVSNLKVYGCNAYMHIFPKRKGRNGMQNQVSAFSFIVVLIARYIDCEM